MIENFGTKTNGNVENSMLTYEIVEPQRPAEQLIIWLHGLGADGHDFENVPAELGLPADHAIRFIFPHAPIQPVTINNGMRMRAWYDIYTGDIFQKVDQPGLQRSQQAVLKLLDKQAFTPDNVILAGFSQGGVVALTTNIEQKLPVAGVIALSSYLPLEQVIPPVDTTFFIAHGTQDALIDWHLGRTAAEQCQAKGNSVIWRTYPMGHNICQSELQDIGVFIKQVFKL